MAERVLTAAGPTAAELARRRRIEDSTGGTDYDTGGSFGDDQGGSDYGADADDLYDSGTDTFGDLRGTVDQGAYDDVPNAPAFGDDESQSAYGDVDIRTYQTLPDDANYGTLPLQPADADDGTQSAYGDVDVRTYQTLPDDSNYGSLTLGPAEPRPLIQRRPRIEQRLNELAGYSRTRPSIRRSPAIAQGLDRQATADDRYEPNYARLPDSPPSPYMSLSELNALNEEFRYDNFRLGRVSPPSEYPAPEVDTGGYQELPVFNPRIPDSTGPSPYAELPVDGRDAVADFAVPGGYAALPTADPLRGYENSDGGQYATLPPNSPSYVDMPANLRPPAAPVAIRSAYGILPSDDNLNETGPSRPQPVPLDRGSTYGRLFEDSELPD